MSAGAEESATHVVDERAGGRRGRRGRRRCRTSRRPSVLPEAGRRAASCRARRTRAWEPAPGRGDPVELLEEQAQTRLPELGPIRYGRMLVVPVRLLPRRRLPDGGRPRGWAADGIARPAVRRRAPLQLRHLRRAGPEARLQHQRLRRDAAGAVRVGREAARRELRGRGPGARLRRCGPPLGGDGGGARVPRGDGALRRDAEHRRLVHAPRRRGRSATSSGQACRASS